MQNGKKCIKCGKPKAESAFYKSSSTNHADGRIPICRKCIIKAAYDAQNDSIDVDNFQKILRQIDKPLIENILDSAIKQHESGVQSGRILAKTGFDRVSAIIGLYFKNLSYLNQYKDMTWEDGNFDNASAQSKKQSASDTVFYLAGNNFKVTNDMIRFFGEGYTAAEYKYMQDTYKTMEQDYPNLTNTQIKMLLRYVRYSAKAYSAYFGMDVTETVKWAKMEDDALALFKQSYSNNSIDNSFSSIMQKIQTATDVSGALPKFEYRQNDAPDFIIWCFINYCRRLEGKSEVEYDNVSDYYDKVKSDFVQQYGDPDWIFSNDTTEKNRQKIKEFITLPPEFNVNDV